MPVKVKDMTVEYPLDIIRWATCITLDFKYISLWRCHLDRLRKKHLYYLTSRVFYVSPRDQTQLDLVASEVLTYPTSAPLARR